MMQRYLLVLVSALLVSLGCQGKPEESDRSAASNKSAESDRSPKRQAVGSGLEKSFYRKHDFGVQDEGQEVSASVELKNDTDKPVRFGFSKASCGCVTIKAIPKEIAPGETGTFEFSLDTTGVSGKRVYSVLAWDAEPMTILAKIESAIMIRSVELQPLAVSLGNIPLDADFEKPVFVKVAGYPDAKIVSAEPDASWLSTELKDASTGDNLKEEGIRAIGCCMVKWTGQGATPGNVSAQVTIKVNVDGKREEMLTVPVRGYVTGSVECLPAHIVFSPLRKDNAVERSCLLTFNRSEPDLDGVTCVTTHGFVSVDIKKKSGVAKQWELKATARFPDNPTAELSSGEVVGKDANGNVVFSIPYSAYVTGLKVK